MSEVRRVFYVVQVDSQIAGHHVSAQLTVQVSGAVELEALVELTGRSYCGTDAIQEFGGWRSPDGELYCEVSSAVQVDEGEFRVLSMHLNGYSFQAEMVNARGWRLDCVAALEAA